jgi:hypothetical protein
VLKEPIALRQITPRSAGAQRKEDASENLAIVRLGRPSSYPFAASSNGAIIVQFGVRQIEASHRTRHLGARSPPRFAASQNLRREGHCGQARLSRLIPMLKGRLAAPPLAPEMIDAEINTVRPARKFQPAPGRALQAASTPLNCYSGVGGYKKSPGRCRGFELLD